MTKNLQQAAYLAGRWDNLWQRLDAARPPAKDIFAQLMAAYGEATRFYHNRDHLEDVLTRLDWARKALGSTGELEQVPAPARHGFFDTIELALWYHDVVYDPTRHDNEARSRDLLLAHATCWALSPKMVQAAADLIDVTARHETASTLSERVVSDCDLAILGATAAAFAKYHAAIRLEYIHTPEEVYEENRRRVLTGLLKQARIYKTDAFHTAFDAAARRNLSAAIAED